MAQVALQKIRITGIKKHYKILMQELHRQGVLHIVENEDFMKKSVREVEDHFGVFDLARLNFAIDFLSPYVEGKMSKIESMLSGGKLVITEAEAKDRLKKIAPHSEAVISACEKLEKRLVTTQNELAKIPAKKTLLQSLLSLGGELRSTYETEGTTTWILKVAIEQENDFLETLATTSNCLDLNILSRTKNELFIRVTVLNEILETVQEILQKFQVEELKMSDLFPEFVGDTVAEAVASLEQREIDLVIDQEACEEAVRKHSAHLEDLKILYDYNAWRKTKNDLQHKIFRSESVFAFEAWMVKAEVKKLQKWIGNVFVGEVDLDCIEKAEAEETPVLLKNAPGIASFEVVTEMYSMPGKKDLDPTKFIAPFFTIFFGFCLSDVGYGMVFSLVAAWFLVYGKFTPQVKNSLLMLLICGFSAILGGVLLGGYFGMTPEQAPGFLLNSAGEFRGQILSPIESPTVLLGIALGFGAIHILFGILLDFANKIRNKEIVSAFADSFAWFCFLLSLMLLGGADMIGINKEMTLLFVQVFAGVLILTQGRSTKNWFLKPLMGIIGLYNITSYLSNLLSYARLMALAIATGVVASVMNTIAVILYDMMPNPFLGIVIALFIIIFGHSLNFALSLLGAFIHTGRLHFIEFFDKFYEGGGIKFQPFTRVKKYLFFTK